MDNFRLFWLFHYFLFHVLLPFVQQMRFLVPLWRHHLFFSRVCSLDSPRCTDSIFKWRLFFTPLRANLVALQSKFTYAPSLHGQLGEGKG